MSLAGSISIRLVPMHDAVNRLFVSGIGLVKLEFHGTDTATDTDFRDAPIV